MVVPSRTMESNCTLSVPTFRPPFALKGKPNLNSFTCPKTPRLSKHVITPKITFFMLLS